MYVSKLYSFLLIFHLWTYHLIYVSQCSSLVERFRILWIDMSCSTMMEPGFKKRKLPVWPCETHLVLPWPWKLQSCLYGPVFKFQYPMTLPSLLDPNTLKCHAKWLEYPCYRKWTDSLYDTASCNVTKCTCYLCDTTFLFVLFRH